MSKEGKNRLGRGLVLFQRERTASNHRKEPRTAASACERVSGPATQPQGAVASSKSQPTEHVGWSAYSLARARCRARLLTISPKPRFSRDARLYFRNRNDECRRKARTGWAEGWSYFSENERRGNHRKEPRTAASACERVSGPATQPQGAVASSKSQPTEHVGWSAYSLARARCRARLLTISPKPRFSRDARLYFRNRNVECRRKARTGWAEGWSYFSENERRAITVRSRARQRAPASE